MPQWLLIKGFMDGNRSAADTQSPFWTQQTHQNHLCLDMKSVEMFWTEEERHQQSGSLRHADFGTESSAVMWTWRLVHVLRSPPWHGSLRGL